MSRRPKKPAAPPELVIPLETVSPPERFDHPELGAQERVDPEAAARRILAAHQAVRGNSTHAALLMGVTYQGLRRAILRFSLPRVCADGTPRQIMIRIGDSEPCSLDSAVQFLRCIPNREANEREARVLLDLAVNENIRLVDIARGMGIDASRLTKFRQRGHLAAEEITSLRQVVSDLREQPVTHRSGRRAAAAA